MGDLEDMLFQLWILLASFRSSNLDIQLLCYRIYSGGEEDWTTDESVHSDIDPYGEEDWDEEVTHDYILKKLKSVDPHEITKYKVDQTSFIVLEYSTKDGNIISRFVYRSGSGINYLVFFGMKKIELNTDESYDILDKMRNMYNSVNEK